MVGAILNQLVGRGCILKDLRKPFKKANHEVGGRGLRLVDLMGMRRTTIAPTPGVFICIEALEECLPKYLPELPRFLRDIIQESPTARISLSGKPHVWRVPSSFRSTGAIMGGAIG